MPCYQLQLYSEYIKQLKVGFRDGKPSVSKPIMLLCMIELIANNNIINNHIYFDDKELISKFDAYYRAHNNLGYKSILEFFKRPFYHLGSEPFYELVWKPGDRAPLSGHTPTARYLREHLAYAKLDDELWELLKDEANREYLKETIIQTYLK